MSFKIITCASLTALLVNFSILPTFAATHLNLPRTQPAPLASRASLPSSRRDVMQNYLAKNNINGQPSSIPDSILVAISRIRGGSDGISQSGENFNAIPNNYYGQAPMEGGQPQPQPNQTENYAQQPMADPLGIANDPMMYGQRETVEDRLAAWRRAQQERQQTQSMAEAASAIDEQGRFKLFTTVSRVSVSFFFFILMWRTVHHYELADVTFGAAASTVSSRNKRGSGGGGGGVGPALLRALVVTPLVVLFLGEMMGAIFGLTGGGTSHATKKRLKGILNLHKGVELVMMIYNVVRLAIVPSKYTPREVYIGRTISNFFFLMQAQLYTKLSWDDVSKTNVGDYPQESYYDDYTPEIGNDDWGNEYGYSSPMQQQQPQYQQQQNYNGQSGWS